MTISIIESAAPRQRKITTLRALPSRVAEMFERR
jgi:hypothetical protein